MKDQNSLSTEQAFKILTDQFRTAAVAYAGLHGGTIPYQEAGVLAEQIMDFVAPKKRWMAFFTARSKYIHFEAPESNSKPLNDDEGGSEGSSANPDYSGEYGEEKRLDDVYRAEDMNKTNKPY